VDYFTADLHLDHANILAYSDRDEFVTPEERAKRALWKAGRSGRPRMSLASVDAMNRGLIGRINERATAGDRLWILGDFTKSATVERVAALRGGIVCRDVRLIYGNHDNRPACRSVFTACYDAVRVLVSRTEPSLTEDEAEAAAERGEVSRRSLSRMKAVYLSHYCHVVWPGSHLGAYQLYGHSHGNLEAWREAHMPSALAMDVGIDAHPTGGVWSWAEIDEVLGAKASRVGPHAVDHHRPGEA